MLIAGCVVEAQLGEFPTAPDVTQPKPTPACITIAPQAIDFGDLDIGQEAFRSVSLTNECSEAITVTDIILVGDSSLSIEETSLEHNEPSSTQHQPAPRAALIIHAGDSISVELAFRPTQSAMAQGEIHFESPLELAPIPLIGNPSGPCLRVVQNELNLGCQIVGTTSWRPVTLKNCGQVAAKVESIEWAADSNPAFTLGSVDLPIVVGVDEEHEVAIGYSPDTDPNQISPIWDVATLEFGTLGYETSLPISIKGFGKTFSCEGLRVVLVWVTPGDPDPKDQGPEAGSDMDLHLLHPFGVDFFDIPFDTYWYNTNPQWGDMNLTSDDPFLSLDDYDSLGPETIILPLPEQDHTYKIGVHYWSDHAFGPSRAQVQLSVFGELIYESPLVELVTGQLWEVGTIQWPSGEVEEFTNENNEPLIHTNFEKPCELITCGK